MIAFEEPENGVHPRRLELVTELLGAMSLRHGRQVVVTTHSPLFCQRVLELQRKHPTQVSLLVVHQAEGETKCREFVASGPLFENGELRKALSDRSEDGWFEGMVLRGLVDD
jgi:predicted ATPase